MQFCIKCIPFSTISETSSGLQASGPLQSIDHIHSTGENTVYMGLSKFVLLLRQKENVFGQKILSKCHLTTSYTWQEVPEKLDLFWSQHCANPVMQLLTCERLMSCQFRAWTRAYICLQKTTRFHSL